MYSQFLSKNFSQLAADCSGWVFFVGPMLPRPMVLGKFTKPPQRSERRVDSVNGSVSFSRRLKVERNQEIMMKFKIEVLSEISLGSWRCNICSSIFQSQDFRMEQIYTMFFLFLGNILCETDITPDKMVSQKETILFQSIHFFKRRKC